MAAANINTRNFDLVVFDKLSDIQIQANYVSSVLSLVVHSNGFGKLPDHFQGATQALFTLSNELEQSLEKYYSMLSELDNSSKFED